MVVVRGVGCLVCLYLSILPVYARLRKSILPKPRLACLYLRRVGEELPQLRLGASDLVRGRGR
eukprot:scaffold40943_cov37-Phaeocystis_antarctica.AAC.3